MPLHVVCHDITQLQVDAIINAASISLAKGSGVCGTTFAAACAESGKGLLQALFFCNQECGSNHNS